MNFTRKTRQQMTGHIQDFTLDLLISSQPFTSNDWFILAIHGIESSYMDKSGSPKMLTWTVQVSIRAWVVLSISLYTIKCSTWPLFCQEAFKWACVLVKHKCLALVKPPLGSNYSRSHLTTIQNENPSTYTLLKVDQSLIVPKEDVKLVSPSY